jgi:Zn-dependent protease
MDERQRTIENLREIAARIQGASASRAQPAAAATEARSHKGSSAARWSRWGVLGLLVVAVLGKLKFVLIALKFLKLSSVLTMLLSIYAYSLVWGWPFAIGFVLLIVVHELGHGIVMRMHGIPAGAPTFIPFVGAVIAMKGRPRNAYVEAKVAFGGPVLGSLGALACLLVAAATQSGFWRSLAFSGFLINLFNLLPVSPLDGGRIAGAISRWMWAVGFAIGIPIFFVTHSPILLIVLIVGLFGLIGRRSEPEGYFDIPASARRAIGLGYFGLAAALAVGAALTHVVMD